MPKTLKTKVRAFSLGGEVRLGATDVRIKVPKKHGAAFKSFMLRELPELQRRFEQSVEDEN